MAACPLLDDLFNWAAQQPIEYQPFVQCSLATNQSVFQGRVENVVTYAAGTLFYDPGGWQGEGRFGRFVPAVFTGVLLQSFSDQLYSLQSTDLYPFSPYATENLQITISSPPLFPAGGSYSVWINSPEWSPVQSLAPQCEAGVIYGIMGDAVFLVISLCGQSIKQMD
jgi:hypothetical protein